MDNPFPERSGKPTKATLARALDRTQRHWDLILEQVHADHDGLVDTWMYYGPKNGWTLKIAGKKRAALWLAPRDGSFLASLALRDDAVAALQATRLPAALIEEIEQAKAWPEGKPARVLVTNLDHVRWVRTLVRIKLGV